MIDWELCATHEATFFPWSEVRASWDGSDAQVSSVAEDFAKEELGHLGRPCASCARPSTALKWISIGASDAAWATGDERCGWITVCPDCHVQVAFILDEEMTQGRRDGNW